MVIIEPDALALTDCLSAADRQTRYDLLRYATTKMNAAGALTYLDAGNSSWQSSAEMTTRLRAAGVDSTRGFSLNVSNYNSTANETNYGQQIRSALGGTKSFVIDTSRNGRATANGQWWLDMAMELARNVG